MDEKANDLLTAGRLLKLLGLLAYAGAGISAFSAFPVQLMLTLFLLGVGVRYFGEVLVEEGVRREQTKR